MKPLILSCFISLGVVTMSFAQPYFGNGIHNSWADQNSIVIWTRLTQTPEINLEGKKFLIPDKEQYELLLQTKNEATLLNAQLPKQSSLNEMDGACPGSEGQVRLTYYPENNLEQQKTIGWKNVNPTANFTRQWKLKKLQPNTTYIVKLEARADRKSPVTDQVEGRFYLPAEPDATSNPSFCIVSCHDYNRRDDEQKGHRIYQAMLKDEPDFYVHTGDIEYYDKAAPYAFTEELMFFQWDRLFGLPWQREFYNKTTSYFMKDDHDTLKDDAFPGQSYGTVSYERGLEIFDKIQFPTHKKRYTTVRWGKDLQVWFLEGRNYRTPNDLADVSAKSVLGKKQKKWLFKTLEASDATFKVIISSTPIVGPDREKKNDNLSNAGFVTEGDEVRNFINQFENVYLCNGDRHWQYVSHPENSNIWEFGCGAGADQHAGGWKQSDFRPEHRFLRVKGGYLHGAIIRDGNEVALRFQHRDVDGNVMHEEQFQAKQQGVNP